MSSSRVRGILFALFAYMSASCSVSAQDISLNADDWQSLSPEEQQAIESILKGAKLLPEDGNVVPSDTARPVQEIATEVLTEEPGVPPGQDITINAENWQRLPREEARGDQEYHNRGQADSTGRRNCPFCPRSPG